MSRPMFTWRHAVLNSGLPPVTRHVLLTLSCHMTDTGESCFPSVEQLVKETGLSKRAILNHIKSVRGQWIDTDRHGFSGQKWARNEYRIRWPETEGGAPDAPPSVEKGGERGAPPSPKGGAPDAPPSTPLDRSSTSFPPLISPPTLTSDGCAVPSDIAEKPDDLIHKTAEWMLGKLLRLNPQHRVPNWRRWEREIRLMVDRDGHTLPEIRDLFGWANQHAFWSTNILSPGKLRKNWDSLVIKRRAESGQGVAAVQPADYRCVRDPAHGRGKRALPGVGWLCAACMEIHERESAHA